MVTSSTPCSAVTSKHMEDRRERQPLCHLAQPPPGQMAKDIASPQRGRNGEATEETLAVVGSLGTLGSPVQHRHLTHWS